MNALAEQLAELPRYAASHLELTLVALALGTLVSLPLGVVATRRPRVEAFALGVASVLQTIPALALLALMVPLFGLLGAGLVGLGLPAPPTIGFLPAVVALALYSVLPMLRNTVTGIAGVDPALREAARGVGMDPRQVLLQVELPLAWPTIVAGIRTATVWVVGMATLATPVGGTSLGNPIFAGLQTRNLSAVLVGSFAAALLALVLDGLIRGIERGLRERSRARTTVALGLLGLLLAGALVVPRLAGAGSGSDATAPIRIGSKTFTEQYVLAEILAGVLSRAARQAGTDELLAVERVPSLGSTVAFDALVEGDLDLYVDYSGTLWATILRESGSGAGRESVLREVEARLARDYGIELLAALGFENTYALALREADAAAWELRTISDLAPHAPRLEMLGDYEFFERPEWRALRDRYALAFAGRRAMDSTLMYEALRSGGGDVISAYSTDGRIAAYGLRVLVDDREVIPPYDAVVLARPGFSRARPGLANALRALEGRLSAELMRTLNAGVDLAGETPEAVAAAWLASCLEPGGASVSRPRDGFRVDCGTTGTGIQGGGRSADP